MLALGLTKVAYMISMKRTSLIMGVIYGYFLFKEKNVRERLSGAVTNVHRLCHDCNGLMNLVLLVGEIYA